MRFGANMERDFKAFPKNDNGDVLWFAYQRGLKIGEKYIVQYALIFPEFNDALKFSLFLLRQGYWVQVNELEDHPGYTAEVLLKMILDVTHEEITGAEAWLAKHSAGLKGKNDGWEIQDQPKEATGCEFAELSND
jgi:hypothetical protein